MYSNPASIARTKDSSLKPGSDFACGMDPVGEIRAMAVSDPRL